MSTPHTSTEQYQQACAIAERHASTPRKEWERALQLETADRLVRELALSMLSAQEDMEGASISGVLGGALSKLRLTTPGPDLLPRVIGNFRLLELRGSGGMGRVYKAQQIDLQRIVAVKQVRGGLLSAGTVERLREEAMTMAQIEHPGIAQVYEASIGGDDTSDSAYIAMEFVDGVTLDEDPSLIGPLPPSWSARRAAIRRRLELMLRICEAVQAAHQRMVIHCDLKPSNVIVRPDGTPKVVDFGIARRLTFEQRVASLAADRAGTLRYMSPERWSGEPGSANAQWDVYSLGVVLHEMLAGCSPFDEQDLTVPGMRRAVVEQGPVELGRLPRGLQRIVQRAVARSPADRYPTVAALADDIRRHLGAGRRLRRIALVSGLATSALGTLVFVITLQAEHAQELGGQIQEKQRATAQAHATAAEFALARGGWREVLREADAALANGHADATALRLKKLRALICMGDHPAARVEVDALQPLVAGTSLEGECLLLDGVVSFFETSRADQALELIQRASTMDLAPADSAYAQGLLAGTGGLARNCLLAAIDADSFHFLAWQSLLTTQLFLGRMVELDRTAQTILAKFPEDTTALVYQVVAAALRGDDARRESLMSRLRERLGSRHYDRMAILCDALIAGRHIFSFDTVINPGGFVASFLQCLNAAQRAGLADREDPHVLFASAPHGMRFLTNGYGYFGRLALNLASLDWNSSARLVDDAILACPSSINVFMRAMLSVMADMQDYHEQAERYRQLLDADPMFPEMDLIAHYGIVGSYQLESQARPSAESRAQVIEALEDVILVPGFPPVMLDQFAYIASSHNDFDLARLFVARWKREHPGDIEALKVQLKIEERALNLAQVIHLSEELTKREPLVTDWQASRDSALEGLKVEVELHSKKD